MHPVRDLVHPKCTPSAPQVQVNITCTLHPGIEMGLHPEVLPEICHPLQSGSGVCMRVVK